MSPTQPLSLAHIFISYLGWLHHSFSHGPSPLLVPVVSHLVSMCHGAVCVWKQQLNKHTHTYKQIIHTAAWSTSESHYCLHVFDLLRSISHKSYEFRQKTCHLMESSQKQTGEKIALYVPIHDSQATRCVFMFFGSQLIFTLTAG